VSLALSVNWSKVKSLDTPTPLPVPETLEVFHLDFRGPLPVSNRFKYVVVVVESTALFPEILVTKTPYTSEMAHILYDDIFTRYGVPKIIITDRGQAFRGQLVSLLCKFMKVKQIELPSGYEQLM
jgi:hypothetical protein